MLLVHPSRMERIRLMAGQASESSKLRKPPASSKFDPFIYKVEQELICARYLSCQMLGTKQTCPVKTCDNSNNDRRRNCQSNLDAPSATNPSSSAHSTMPATHTIKATDLSVHSVTVFQADRAEVNRLVPVELKVGHAFIFHFTPRHSHINI